MPALPTGAIPAVPQNLGADDAARQEYFEALNKVLNSLEQRGSQGPNLWSVAAQFLNPGRTGGFGEALGNVAASVGKDIEKQQEYDLPIAQMRAQIAQQKYTLAQNEQSMKTLNQLYGGQIFPSTPGVSAQTQAQSADRPAGVGAVQPARGTAVGSDGGWLPDQRTVSMMVAANGGDARPVLQEIAKARMKLAEPTDVMKDLAALEDPKVSNIVKMGIATRYLEGAVKPFDMRTATGTLQSNALEQIKKLITGILDQGAAAPTDKPPAAPTDKPPAAPTDKPPAAKEAAGTTAKPVEPQAKVGEKPIEPAKPGEPPKTIISPSDLAKKIEKEFGIKLGPLALTRTAAQQQDLINRHARGEKNIFTPAPIVPGKTIYHENAIDVPTSVPESYLKDHGYYRPYKDDPVHAIPMPGYSPAKPVTVAAAPTDRPAAADVKMFTTSDGFQVPMPPPPPAVATPPGFAPGSSEALEARRKGIEQSREYMYRKDGPLDKARIAYDAANNNMQNYTNIINSVQNIKGGIAAVPLQTWDKLVDAFGFSTPDQYRRMISTGVVDKATKEIVANDLKAAFGGNPTEGERKYLNEALINISDPKELILFAALTRKAIAARNIARFEYISQNVDAGLNAEKTFDAWYRKQNLSLFEPELIKMEPRIFGKRPEGSPAERKPVYLGNREIVPNARNDGWVYKDDKTPVPK